MDTHIEHTVPQTSVRQSLIHFTQVGQALPAHPLFLSAIDSRFTTFTRLVKMLWATTSFGIHKTTQSAHSQTSCEAWDAQDKT